MCSPGWWEGMGCVGGGEGKCTGIIDELNLIDH